MSIREKINIKEKVNILLVDDQPGRLLSYEAILSDLGENLVQARSGTEALQRLMEADFAVILLDVSMPDMDGFETASLIHQHPRYENTPIIFVTAIHLTDFDRKKAYKLGAVDYVYIPVVPEILRSKVAVLVELFSKRRELEKLNRSLEQANAELAQSNSIFRAEKTRELEELNKRLTQANAVLAETNAVLHAEIVERKRLDKSLRDADRRKDEFLAILAHELRNPLNAISNAVKLLHLPEVEESEQEWSRDVIERQVEHLTRLINDLLDVSRITRNKLELRKERVELGEIIRGAVDGSRPLFDRGKHEVTLNLPANPVFVNADRIRLAQVFMNLLDNAAKYTPAGGSIWMTAEVANGGSTPGSEEAVVRVRDTGVGIAPEKLSQLFDMFYQVDVSLVRSHGGLGIGLTLVRQLVEMHGGNVEALSRGLGKGSEFIIRVPVLDDRSKAEQPEVLDGEEMSTPAGRRILIADDNRDSAESMARLLRLLRNEVQTAYNGIDAVEIAQRFHPDIVLLDIGMPMLNGYEAVRAIREQPWSKNAVMIALTGWGQEEDRRRSREAGFDDHLIKPVDHTALMGLLARLPAGSSMLAGTEWQSASDSGGPGEPLQLIDPEPPPAARQDRPEQMS